MYGKILKVKNMTLKRRHNKSRTQKKGGAFFTKSKKSSVKASPPIRMGPSRKQVVLDVMLVLPFEKESKIETILEKNYPDENFGNYFSYTKNVLPAIINTVLAETDLKPHITKNKKSRRRLRNKTVYSKGKEIIPPNDFVNDKLYLDLINNDLKNKYTSNPTNSDGEYGVEGTNFKDGEIQKFLGGMQNLSSFSREKLAKLDRIMPGAYNFSEQEKKRMNNTVLNTKDDKYNCHTLHDKYSFFEGWLRNFFAKFKDTNPKMKFKMRWSTASGGPDGTGTIIRNNQDISNLVDRMLHRERDGIAKKFLKNIAQAKMQIDGGYHTLVQNTTDEIYIPILTVSKFDDYLNIIGAECPDYGVSVNVYEIYSREIPNSPFYFSIMDLNVDNLKEQINIIREGINVLKNQIKRTCVIRSSRTNMM